MSDHGMVEANTSNPIQYPAIDEKKFIVTTDETMIQLYAKDVKDIQTTYEALVKTKEASRYDVVLKKDNTLFATGSKDPHNRIGDILLIAKSPYQFQFQDDKNSTTGTIKYKALKKGCHGYDPKNNPAMNATFFAWGSAFNKTTIPSFKNVDVYPLVAHTLGLKYTHPIDGNKNTLVNAKVLKNIK